MSIDDVLLSILAAFFILAMGLGIILCVFVLFNDAKNDPWGERKDRK